MQIDHCSFQNKTACADYLLLVVMLYNRDTEISANTLAHRLHKTQLQMGSI